MLSKQKLESLTDEQILQLNNVLERFSCGAIFCDYCPMYLGEVVTCKFPNAPIEDHKTRCLCVYIAARALEVKSKSTP